jgi:hypothetical protein
VNWIGIALSIVAIGIGLWPLAGELPAFVRPLAMALTVAGLIMCLIPVWKRVQEKRGPKPLAVLKKLVEGNDVFKGVQSADDFNKAIVELAAKGLIKVFGIPGELNGVTNKLVEIQPNYFKNHSIWVQWTTDGYVSETYRNDIGFINAIATDKGRYFRLHASPNVLDEIIKYVRALSNKDEGQTVMTSPS